MGVTWGSPQTSRVLKILLLSRCWAVLRGEGAGFKVLEPHFCRNRCCRDSWLFSICRGGGTTRKIGPFFICVCVTVAGTRLHLLGTYLRKVVRGEVRFGVMFFHEVVGPSNKTMGKLEGQDRGQDVHLRLERSRRGRGLVQFVTYVVGVFTYVGQGVGSLFDSFGVTRFPFFVICVGTQQGGHFRDVFRFNVIFTKCGYVWVIGVRNGHFAGCGTLFFFILQVVTRVTRFAVRFFVFQRGDRIGAFTCQLNYSVYGVVQGLFTGRRVFFKFGTVGTVAVISVGGVFGTNFSVMFVVWVQLSYTRNRNAFVLVRVGRKWGHNVSGTLFYVGVGQVCGLKSTRSYTNSLLHRFLVGLVLLCVFGPRVGGRCKQGGTRGVVRGSVTCHTGDLKGQRTKTDNGDGLCCGRGGPRNGNYATRGSMNTLFGLLVFLPVIMFFELWSIFRFVFRLPPRRAHHQAGHDQRPLQPPGAGHHGHGTAVHSSGL